MDLKPGDQVPRFEVRTFDGQIARYGDLWQRKNLLLVTLPETPSPARDGYVVELERHRAELTAHDTAFVLTAAPVAGVPRPGFLVADRWGEVIHVAAAASMGDVAALPPVSDLIEWLRFTQSQCPECQGESR